MPTPQEQLEQVANLGQRVKCAKRALQAQIAHKEEAALSTEVTTALVDVRKGLIVRPVDIEPEPIEPVE